MRWTNRRFGRTWSKKRGRLWRRSGWIRANPRRMARVILFRTAPALKRRGGWRWPGGLQRGSGASHRLLLGGWDDFVHADAEIVVENQDFAAGNQAIVDENIHGVAGQFVQLHHA